MFFCQPILAKYLFCYIYTQKNRLFGGFRYVLLIFNLIDNHRC